MAEQTTLADLGKAMGMATAAQAAAAAPAKPKLDAKGRAYATGRRKNAIARVWIKRGSGKITVNGKAIETYFARPVLRMMVQQPLVLANRATQFDVDCTVTGGGLSGQAGAVRHGIVAALTYFEPELRGVLKKAGFLTRDSRAGRAQEVRPGQGPPQLPVLEALSAAAFADAFRGICERSQVPFFVRAQAFEARQLGSRSFAAKGSMGAVECIPMTPIGQGPISRY